MSAYSLIKYPIEDIKWFLRELVKAGGNATEAFAVSTWDETWRWQPYKIAKWETEKWKDAPWNHMGPDYAFPVFDLSEWNEDVWAKWRGILALCRKMNVTIIVRVQGFCSRKDNFLERHWAIWSCVQSWRWGGKMSGGYLRWPIGEGYIWPHYDRLNGRLISELEAAAVKFYLEPRNELSVTKGSQYDPDAPDELTINIEVHKWFAESFKRHGCPPDRILCNVQRLGMSGSEWAAQAERAKALGFIIEYHGCASPETMRERVSLFGAGRKTFPNGDGTDSNAKGINDGRPGYTEPPFDQAVEMGKIVKREGLLGYIYKGRKFRKTQDLRKADFTGVRGSVKGIKNV